MLDTNTFSFVCHKPNSLVGGVQDFRKESLWFDPQLGQYSFRRFMIVIATGFIPLTPLSIVSSMAMLESSQWLGKNIVRSTMYLEKKFEKRMDRCTGHHDMTEMMLKTALNTKLSINLLCLQYFKICF